jgi:hypothetical protein
MLRELIDSMPLWGILIATITIVGMATEVGFRLGVFRSKGAEFNNETQITSMTGAHLGLLAFLLAFTFSMAAGHFDARKKVMLEETKVIGVAYLRSRLIPGQESENIRALLREYTNLRSTIGGGTDIPSLVRNSEQLQSQLWREVETLVAGDQPTVMHSLLIQAINAVFSVHEDRLSAGLHNRIPPSIWVALYAVLLLSMVGMGYHSGMKGARSPVPTAALAVSFSMVLFLIADLDRPASGLVMTDQASMIELGARLQRSIQ